MSFVTGITINCTSERGNGGGIFRPVQVDAKHPIYQHGIVAPVSKLVDLPLLVYKHPLKATRDMALQNEIAQVLMVGKDGKTTTDFTENPGSVTIVRKDGKPLTRPAIEAIWMFNDYFLEQLQDDKGIAEQLLNRTDFDNFCEDYKEDRILQGHATFTRLELPL